MIPAPTVTIVILNWNGLADTRECLDSLRAVTYPNARVVVVDNGSTEAEGQLLKKEFGGYIHLIENETNTGFAGGANTGIRYALEQGAGYMLLLNNDTVVQPQFLEAMVQAAESTPDVAAVCPRTYFFDRPDVIYSTGGSYSLWRGTARQVGRGRPDRGQFDAPAQRDYADGVCMLIPRGAIERVGLLDEDYFAYWEETDWCARARQQGLRCYYVPGAKVWHRAARSQDPDPGFHYLYRRNALLFVRKRGSPLQVLTALLMHVLVYGPLYFLRHPTKAARAAAEARALLWHASNQARRRPLV
ncbi:MAG: glycosyltransferase family 2 protein [Dehalococcoidia bacterium]|nr:glycosyltransferase family 2 protein [Dehalococcoidia bacterium]